MLNIFKKKYLNKCMNVFVQFILLKHGTFEIMALFVFRPENDLIVYSSTGHDELQQSLATYLPLQILSQQVSLLSSYLY